MLLGIKNYFVWLEGGGFGSLKNKLVKADLIETISRLYKTPIILQQKIKNFPE